MDTLDSSLLDAVLNATDTGYVVFDRQGIVRIVNEHARLRAKHGYGVDLKPGSSIYEIVVPEDREGFDRHVARCLAGENISFVKSIRLPNAPAKHFRFTFRPVARAGAEPWGVCMASQDMDPLLTMEERLHLAGYVMDQSPASVVITDTEGAIEYVNPRFSQITGYGAAEAVGKNPRILKSGEQSREFYAELWATIAAGKRWRGEFHNRRKDGSLFWEEAFIQAILDREGKIKHYIAIKEDISERKAAEERLTKLIGEKDVLIKELYHRTRNNLQTIGALAFLLASEDETLTVAEFLSSLEGWIHALAMVQDELYYSRDLSRIQFRGLAESLILHTLDEGRRKGWDIRFEARLPDDMDVPIDSANVLGLVLRELAFHAVDVGPEESRPLGITLEGFLSGTTLSLTYRDDADESLIGPRKFRDFGLTIAESMVREQLGGKIRIERGGGLRCEMQIPIPATPSA